MSDSLLKGTVWHWRQGIRLAPIHGDDAKTTELYMSVGDTNQAKDIIDELKENGITASTKITHSTYDVVPAGSLIVFAARSQEVEIKEERENVEKLRTYILANGGKIDDNSEPPSVLKSFMRRLFGRQ